MPRVAPSATGLAKSRAKRDGSRLLEIIAVQIMAFISDHHLFSLSALLALIPVAIGTLRREQKGRDGVYWSLLGVAVAGPMVWALVQISGSWMTGLSTALWATIAVSMFIFAGTVLLTRQAWRLTPLMGLIMGVLGFLAVLWQNVPQKALGASMQAGLVQVHILTSVATYALVTIAAVAALAAFLQERALKSRRPTSLTRTLPSVIDCEFLLVRLLTLGEIVLGVGLVTGMTIQYRNTGNLLHFDHKTILTLTSFVVIGILLTAHFKSGIRGRMATRMVLLAYLLMTLGYPGVKFVSDVLLS